MICRIMGRAIRKNQRLAHLLPHESMVTQLSCSTLSYVIQNLMPRVRSAHSSFSSVFRIWQRSHSPVTIQQQAGGTACIQRLRVQGRASFLPQELLWHIPMPCVLLPSCQSPSFSECGCRGNAPLTLCVSAHRISFCRLLSTQRSATSKQGRSEDFSQQRLQVLCNGDQQVCCQLKPQPQLKCT